MPIRKRTIRKMSPVARKLARFVNEFQSTTRRLKYLLSDIQDLESVVEAHTFNEKEANDVFPQNRGALNPEDLPRGKKRQSRHDRVGKPGNRRGAANGRKRRKPRSKRKALKKGERK